MEYLVGVDEVGRGPLAGPVAVGVAVVPVDFDWQQLAGVTDSKKLTPENREAIFRQALKLKKAEVLNFAVSQVSAAVIDRIGIVPAISQAMERAFLRLAPSPDHSLVKLDGGLAAPHQFLNQETIIKGDSKEQVIGLASIVAKVTRDRYMRRIAPQFAAYNFATHKGYGTKAHRHAIAQHGLSVQHRSTYCKNIKILYKNNSD